MHMSAAILTAVKGTTVPCIVKLLHSQVLVCKMCAAAEEYAKHSTALHCTAVFIQPVKVCIILQCNDCRDVCTQLTVRSAYR